ncbi:MAG: hypothetical protein ACYDBB_02130 [Armatimonadota bacterium]
MGITIDKLVDRLGNAGYPVTKRRMIDWIEKGLLPPQKSQGLGRGKGKLYYWSQPDILQHAMTTYELLEGYGRVKGAYLPLWLFGYTVPVKKVKDKLIEALAWINDLSKENRDGLTFEDKLDDLANDVVLRNRQWNNSPYIDSAEYQSYYTDVVCSINLCKAFTCEDFQLSDEFDELPNKLIIDDQHTNRITTSNKPLFIQDKTIIKFIMVFCNRHIPLVKWYNCILSATDDELDQSHIDLYAINQILQVIEKSERQTNAESLRRALLLVVGPYLIAADIWYRREGYSEKIEAWLRDVADLVNNQQ